jgi:hypothetical protein
LQEKDEASLHCACVAPARRRRVIDNATAVPPCGVVNPARKAPPTIDDKSALHCGRAPARPQRSSDDGVDCPEYFLSDVFRKKRCPQPVRRAEHQHPGRRAVGDRRFLDNTHRNDRVAFEAADLSRHEHLEQARLMHRAQQGRWNPPLALDLVAQLDDGWLQPSGRIDEFGAA